MPEHPLYLVAGLGNPGQDYANTRHNVGFMVVDALARKYGISVQRGKFDVLFGRGTISGKDVVLAKPQAYMNRSGPGLQQLANFFKIPNEAMVVVHDDIDLAFNRTKIKEKGGDGGHKGIRSIIGAFGGGEFIRLRIGVGRSEDQRDVVDYVLGEFKHDQKQLLSDLLDTACEAIVAILTKGAKDGMNRYNQNPR